MTVDRRVRCYYCGNGETADMILVHDKGRIVHESSDPDADYWCPKPPEGWTVCVQCRAAVPMGNHLVETYVVDPGRNGYYLRADRWPKDTELSVRADEVTGETLVFWSHRWGCSSSQRDEEPTKEKIDPEVARATADQARADALPLKAPGLPIADMSALWGVKERQAKTIVSRLLTAGLIESEELPQARGGAPKKVYRRRES